jgi:hypothetical protein
VCVKVPAFNQSCDVANGIPSKIRGLRCRLESLLHFLKKPGTSK